MLFSIAEARAFRYQGQAQLASVTDYPDALIAATAVRIGADFAQICGVAFEPTEAEVELDGPGCDLLLLPDPRVSSVDAIARWDGTAWAPVTSAYRLTLGGLLLTGAASWTRGAASIRVTYTHGYDEPPPQVKLAALILAVNDLVGSNISDRATQQTNEYGAFNLSVPGWREGQWYGLPPVDSALQRYCEHTPRVG